jgi:leader peptidase (prepilin peptidase)/N-methyltransferase
VIDNKGHLPSLSKPRYGERRLNPLPAPLFRAALVIFGALVGSFLNVVIARLPAGESLVRPRSKCPSCGSMIPAYLNVPILSWLILRGRCAQCKKPISIRYPIVEILTSILFLAIGERYQWSLATIAGVLLAGSLIAITFIDIDIWEIPDEISVPLIVIGCVLRPLAFGVPWYDGVLGAAVGAFLLFGMRWIATKALKQEGMGLGDVKLIAAIGAFVGPVGLLPTIFVASAVGSVVGILLLALRKGPPAPPPLPPDASPDEEQWVPPAHGVPFGPFLSIGALASLLFGRILLHWMVGLPL